MSELIENYHEGNRLKVEGDRLFAEGDLSGAMDTYCAAFTRYKTVFTQIPTDPLKTADHMEGIRTISRANSLYIKKRVEEMRRLENVTTA